MTSEPTLIEATRTSEGTHRLQLSLAVAVFLGGAWMLELQLPAVGANLGNLWLAAGCLVATAACFVARSRARLHGMTFMHQDFVYLLYIAFALASAAWSPSPTRTAFHALLLGCVWLATVNLGDASLIVALRLTLILAIVTALASIAIAPLSPAIAFQPAASTDVPELRGIFGHQLRLGLFMSMALGLAVVAWLNRDAAVLMGGNKRAVLAVILFGSCILAAFARLYSAAMVLSLILTLGLSRRGWRRAICVASLGITGLLIVSQPDALVAFLLDRGFDITLTGRTVIWARTLTAFDASNLLGYGYASFDHSNFDWLWSYYRPAHPHNSYIQAFFETGAIGLGLTILLIAVQLRLSLRIADRTGRYPYSLFLVLLAMIGSVTGSNYAGKPTILISVLLLVLAIEARGIRSPNPVANMVGRVAKAQRADQISPRPDDEALNTSA